MYINEYGNRSDPTIILMAPLLVSGTVERYMNSMFKNQKKRLTGPEIEIPAGLIKDYGHDFAGMMTGNLVQLTLKDAEAISHACCHYDLRPLTRQEQRKLHLDYGEKDFALKYSKKALSRHMPEAETAVRKGCSHCGYMAAHMKKYVEKMEDFIKMRPA